MDVNFTDKIVKMVLLAGLADADADVKKEILSNDKLEKLSLEHTISTVQIREQALRSFTNVRTPASAETPKTAVKSNPRFKKESKCEKCSKSFKYFILTRAKRIIKVKECRYCYKKSQQQQQDKNVKQEDAKPNGSEEKSIMWDMMALEHVTGVTSEISTTASKSGWSVRVQNMVFDWKKDGNDDLQILIQY